METNRMVLVVAAGAGVAAVAWYFLRTPEPPPLPPPVPAKVAQPAAPEPAKPEHYPAPPAQAEPEAKPLPALDESDGALLAAVAAVIGRDAAGRFLVPERLVRNIVVTVDNLPRRSFAISLLP